MNAHQQKIRHLYHRAGFGMDLATWKEVKQKSIRKTVHHILKQSQTIDDLLVEAPAVENSMQSFAMLSQEEKAMLAKQGRESIRNLNVAWFRRMATSKAQLREKMTLFWHDHFACRTNRYRLVEMQHNTLRRYALGNFGDLLLAVSKDPAMLQFLNNQQNRKKAPNENFARELLELFTMGRGNYTEQDVKEAARAFTGWGFNFEGEFVFRKRVHDEGQKTFMGETGNFDGQDIIRIVLAQKQTARYLTTKLYQYLVNEEVDEAQVETWATFFYQHDYHIGKLLEQIFTSDHFYESQHMGTRIKSPTEYLVGIMRHLKLDLVKEQGFMYMQRILGQVLFQPPNVAGWPQGKAWIDSSSLMARLRLPQVLIMADEIDIEAKENFAGGEELFKVQQRVRKNISTTIDWQPLLKVISSTKNEEGATQFLQNYLMARPVQQLAAKDLKPYILPTDPELTVRQLCARLMCTPEYQFC